MATAVCIITHSGMKCLASPIKNHFPTGRKCKVAKEDPKLNDKMELIAAVLRTKGSRVPKGERKQGMDLSEGEQAMIAKVVKLMLAAKVGGKTAFTIVSAG